MRVSVREKTSKKTAKYSDLNVGCPWQKNPPNLPLSKRIKVILEIKLSNCSQALALLLPPKGRVLSQWRKGGMAWFSPTLSRNQEDGDGQKMSCNEEAAPTQLKKVRESKFFVSWIQVLQGPDQNHEPYV